MADIKLLVNEGKNREAAEALDLLLSMAPNNIEALKLRAQLATQEGRFLDEAQVWEKIVSLDQDDTDALTYLYYRQLEDREHFYFTDDMPEGGRRYLTFPKSLMTFLSLGLLGCVTFWLVTRLSKVFIVLANPAVVMATFALFVLAPWFGILINYFRALHAIVISERGLAVATRMRVLFFSWRELGTVYLAYSSKSSLPGPTLVLLPANPDRPRIEIDLARETSAVKAKGYLIREIKRLATSLDHVRYEELPAPRRTTIRY